MLLVARLLANDAFAAVKRIMQEARELANDPCTDYTAAPLEVRICQPHCKWRSDVLPRMTSL